MPTMRLNAPHSQANAPMDAQMGPSIFDTACENDNCVDQKLGMCACVRHETEPTDVFHAFMPEEDDRNHVQLEYQIL